MHIPGPGKKVKSIRGSVKQETTKDNHSKVQRKLSDKREKQLVFIEGEHNPMGFELTPACALLETLNSVKNCSFMFPFVVQKILDTKCCRSNN